MGTVIKESSYDDVKNTFNVIGAFFENIFKIFFTCDDVFEYVFKIILKILTQPFEKTLFKITKTHLGFFYPLLRVGNHLKTGNKLVEL